MSNQKIIIDTNVLISALKSNKGASFKLVSLIGTEKFEICISVPLVLEYEDVAKRTAHYLAEEDIQNLINYICAVGLKRKIHFLWRPFLKDPNDDMILELAVSSQSQHIITFNKKDFEGVEKFGLSVLTPKEFLEKEDLI